MAFRFGTDERVQHAIVRCAREQLDRPVGELSEGSNDPVKAIHDARKAIKKERSLLRLAAGAMPPPQRRRDNGALRETGRALSAARDADVMIASLDKLSEHLAGQLPSTTSDAVRRQLEADRAATTGGGIGSALEAHAVRELGAVRVRVEDWRLGEAGWQAIDSGLQRTYKRGRGALALAARPGRSDEDLHAWRKRVKDLWYHERLLAPTTGPTVRGHAKELDRPADLLGDDHDLALLRQGLTKRAMPVPIDVDAVVGVIDCRRPALQTEAIGISKRVYAESPKAYMRRMRRTWTAGRALARAARKRHPAELAAATREPHQH